MDVVWLASYPKSGNTWLRFLLYCYLYGTPDDTSQVATKIPDLHRLGPEALTNRKGNVLCKTHFLPAQGHPHIAETKGFVYLIRNPRDVLLSALNYKRTLGKLDETDEQFALRFIDNMGAPDWRQHGYGSWVEHVSYWMGAAAKLPHLILRYEQMKADPIPALEETLRFLGITPDPERVASAVEASSFSSMKNMEKTERDEGKTTGFFMAQYAGRGGNEGGMFMNQGRSDQRLSVISEEVAERFEARFGSVARLLGYSLDERDT